VNKLFDGKTYSEWAADQEAKDRARWEASGTPLAFEEWRQQEAEREKAEAEERLQEEARAEAKARRIATLGKQIPSRYRHAETDDPQLIAWVGKLLDWTRQLRSIERARRVEGWYDEPTRDPLDPDVEVDIAGPSLLLLGPTGVGKTHHAFGALRRYVGEPGGSAAIVITAAADMYAALRPRSGVDSEDAFSRYAKAPVLFIDDLGAAKTSEWVEEINYRLINYRYNHQLATLFTSNVPVRELAEYLGERVASRITGMAATVALKGPDRRRA
jgi:DNA replication protein DnaC